MNRRKKTGILAIILSLAFVFGLFGCSSNPPSQPDSGKLKIVTTIFPEYDWMMQVLGAESERAEVTLLMDSGTDLHSYQPSARDISRISSCDLLVYTGGESDKWIGDVLNGRINQEMKTVSLLEVLGDKVKEEEIVEGMEGQSEEDEYDEHVWLSLLNAEVFVREFAQVLGEMDPINRDVYSANADSYINKLEDLHQRYKAMVESSGKKTLVFADRFPFRYLADDYDLNYYAAFAGCSAESEASFETIRFLAQKVDEYGLNCVIKIEGGDERIAQTVINNTAGRNQKIVVLDSLQSTTAREIAEGISYLSVMEDNLKALTEALK